MKKVIYIVLFFFIGFANAQKQTTNTQFAFDYFYGNIIEHSPQLKPVIQGHPKGFIASWNKKNVKDSIFNHTYNFPDVGFSASYHNFNSTSLGKVYAAYTHYNFYLNNINSKNHLTLTTAIGLGYATHPFNKETNSKNWAIGSKFLASAYLKFNYQRSYLFNKFGVNAGFVLIHYSNTGFKAPNLGINTVALTTGIHYNFEEFKQVPVRTKIVQKEQHNIKYNAVLRVGANESKINGSGKFPFYTVSFYADKKLNHKSTVSMGTDLFFASFMKEYINYENAINNANSNADWKRIGVFVGHELNIQHISIVSQIGYHAYAPYKYVSGIYERFGFKKQINEHLFTNLTLKINLFRAEGLEFGVGYKF